MVVEGGALEVNGYDNGHLNKIKQLTVKNGATVSGYSRLDKGTGFQSTKYINDPNIGNTVIERGVFCKLAAHIKTQLPPMVLSQEI